MEKHKCSFCSELAEAVSVKIDQGILEEAFFCEEHICNYSHPVKENNTQDDDSSVKHDDVRKEAFVEILKDIFDQVDQKQGYIDCVVPENNDIASLEKDILSLVEKENFIEATKLRDKIKVMKENEQHKKEEKDVEDKSSGRNDSGIEKRRNSNDDCDNGQGSTTGLC